jgi:hypothetical protein
MSFRILIRNGFYFILIQLFSPKANGASRLSSPPASPESASGGRWWAGGKPGKIILKILFIPVKKLF